MTKEPTLKSTLSVEEEAELKFHPTLEANYRLSDNYHDDRKKFLEKITKTDKEKKVKKEIEREIEKEYEEMKDCTFQPNILKPKRKKNQKISPSKNEEGIKEKDKENVYDQLYKEGEERQKRMRQREVSEENRRAQEMTFKPQLYERINPDN
jgi:hypothetical protein